MRENIIESMVQYYKSNIELHRLNIEVLLERTVGLADHPSLTETIDGELSKMAQLDDKIVIIENYFGD